MKRSFFITLLLVSALGVAQAEYVQLTSVMDLHTMGTDSDGLDLNNAFIAIYPPKTGPAGEFFKMRAKESTLEVPFVSGPWKGGKALFEFPRDLSYMEVTILDKHGDRQRLYSVRSKPYESGRLSTDGSQSTLTATSPAPPTPGVTPSDAKETRAVVAALPRREAVTIPVPAPAPTEPVALTDNDLQQMRQKDREAQHQAMEKLKTSQDVATDVFQHDDVVAKNAPAPVATPPAPMLDPRVAQLAAAPIAAKPAALPVAEHSMDVNDPEYGVKQINLTDKFSGGRYGRHREYERRVVYGKRPSSPVKNYDYYVDEVDRKKESHILSYYQHEANGKNKLVAVQKHENVTFLSNYDIADDGPAKVWTH